MINLLRDRLEPLVRDVARLAGIWRHASDRAARELAHVPRWAVLYTSQGERFAGLITLGPAVWEVQIGGDPSRVTWIPAFRVARIDLCDRDRALHVAHAADLRREDQEARESDTRALRPVPPQEPDR